MAPNHNAHKVIYNTFAIRNSQLNKLQVQPTIHSPFVPSIQHKDHTLQIPQQAYMQHKHCGLYDPTNQNARIPATCRCTYTLRSVPIVTHKQIRNYLIQIELLKQLHYLNFTKSDTTPHNHRYQLPNCRGLGSPIQLNPLRQLIRRWISSVLKQP